jgi:hypothetical protein
MKGCEQYDVLASTMSSTVRSQHDKLSYWAYLSYCNIVLDRASTMSGTMICCQHGTLLARCRCVLPIFSTLLARCLSYRNHRRHAPGTIQISCWGPVLRTGNGSARCWHGALLARYAPGTIIFQNCVFSQIEITAAEASAKCKLRWASI